MDACVNPIVQIETRGASMPVQRAPAVEVPASRGRSLDVLLTETGRERRRGGLTRLAALVIGLAGVLAAVAGPAVAADPSTVGAWGPVIDWPEVSVHAALTPSGKILTIQGDFSSGGQQYLFNPADNSAEQVPNAAVDLFCAGQAVTADGRVLVIGGTATSGGLGIRDVTSFDWTTQSWRELAPMHHGRWYATGTTLGDGRVLVTSGYDKDASDLVTTPEVYDVHANRWTDLVGATQAQPVYPFQYQLPDGRVLWAGASETASETKVLDVGAQRWSTVDARVIDGASIANYAPGKFLKAGSAADSGETGASSKTAFTLDMTAPHPTWQPTGDMAVPRSFVNLTNLPDGSVLATGGDTEKSGYDDANAALSAERWDPATGAWTTLASMTVPRLYHSTAVLLPDGRVFVSGGGGDPGVPDHRNIELYSPPYLSNGSRPRITSAPATGFYGSTATIATPDDASIASVSLLRTGSVTHSFDQNARAMKLPFTRAAGQLHVQLPPDANTAPPGYYMLFIVNAKGVPSIGKMVRFPAAYEGLVPVPPGDQTPPAITPPPPSAEPLPAETSVAVFKLSSRTLRVSKSGRFKYSFRATPFKRGKLSLKSSRKVKVVTKKRFMRLAAKRFTASSTGRATVKFRLSRKNLRALRSVGKLRFKASATLGGTTRTSVITLRTPR